MTFQDFNKTLHKNSDEFSQLYGKCPTVLYINKFKMRDIWALQGLDWLSIQITNTFCYDEKIIKRILQKTIRNVKFVFVKDEQITDYAFGCKGIKELMQFKIIN